MENIHRRWANRHVQRQIRSLRFSLRCHPSKEPRDSKGFHSRTDMRVIAFSLLAIGVTACFTTAPTLTQSAIEPGKCASPVVIEKHTCVPRQCGIIGDVFCGNCEDLKGYTCGPDNICINACQEMELDDRCAGINEGYYNHQYSLRCHKGFLKLECVTMTDYIRPDDGVRCCHIPKEE